MTALFEAMSDTPASRAIEPPRTVDGARWLMRCGQRMVGAESALSDACLRASLVGALRDAAKL